MIQKVSIWSAGSSRSSQSFPKISIRSGRLRRLLVSIWSSRSLQILKTRGGQYFPGSDNSVLARYSKTKWRMSIAEQVSWHAVRDSASPNPKMHQKRKTIEIEMYCGSKYNKTAGTWSLTLVRLVNFIIFSGKGKSWIKFCTWFNLLQALFNIYAQNDPCKVEPSTGKT